MTFKNNILILSITVFFIGCGNSITVENFSDFKNSIDKIDNTEKTLENNELTLIEKTEKYFGQLDEKKKKELLNTEIQTLYKNNDIKLASSSMVMNTDTIANNLIRKCGTYDSADSTIAKNFSNRRMIMPQILTITQNIPINFYIIEKNEVSSNISNSLLQNQIEILNLAFSSVNIRFSINEINFYRNDLS